MSARIKVALIGAGGSAHDLGLAAGFTNPGHWGQQHARILSLRPDVDFCAIVGRNELTTKERAAELGTRAYTDIDEMLRKEKPDLVSLCLPNQGHYAATLQVIQAGFPLFVEKPLVFDLGEAEILVEEARQRNLFFAINFNHRYAKPVQLAKRAIQEGKLGQLIFASWRFGGEGASDHPHANLIETQCHGFDTLEYLYGPIESVMAEMTDRTGKGFSSIVLTLRFVNGALGSLIGTYDSSYAYTDTHRMELNGTEGRIVIQDTVKSYTYQKSGNETAEVWQAGYFNDVDREFHRTFDKHMDAILDCFRKGQEPPIHASAGHRALAVAQAAIDSYSQGARVFVNPLYTEGGSL